MAIQREIWTSFIIENLFKGNEFLGNSFNADEYVNQGKIVHIPKAGAKPNVERNRSQIPAVVVQRADQDVLYALDEYTTDPTHIPHADTVELSYDKIANVLSDHMDALREVTADNMLVHWAASLNPTENAQQLRTTGGGGMTPALVPAAAPGASGNRKKFMKEDLKAAQTLMNRLNIPKNDRYALIPSDMLSYLMDDADLLKRDSAMELDLESGVIMKLYGFKIMERSTVLVYNDDPTPVVKPYGAIGHQDDNLAVLCWQKGCVERALGEVNFFENIGDATYYGDVYSALIRMGGRIRRPEGVVAIIEEH